MRRTTRIIIWVAAVLITILLITALALHLFVDAETYRDFIQAQLEKATGREVGFGEMKLSFLPTIGLRLDDFEVRGLPDESEEIVLSAKSLRAGARLLPLLRKRLEVGSIVIDRPALTLHRAADGSWRPASLLAEQGNEGARETESGSFSVRDIRIKEGRLRLLMEGAGELTLEELSLRLKDVAAGRPFKYEISAAVGEMPGSSISLEGAGMMDGSGLSGSIEAADLAPGVLLGMARAFPGLAALPAELLGERPFSVSTGFELAPGEGVLRLTDTRLADIELNLERDAGGEWSVARLLEELRATPEGGGDALKVELGGLSLEDVSIHVEDLSAPLSFDLADLQLKLGALKPDAPVDFELACALETGAGSGRLTASGTVGPQIDLELELQPVAAGGLAALLPKFAGLDAAAAEIGLKMKVSGDPAKRAELSGGATLSGLTVSLEDPVKGRRSVPLDLKIDGGIVMIDGGKRLELSDVAIAPGRGAASGPISFRGTIDLSGELTVVDIQLLPARIVADDLAALAALLAPDAPLGFSSPDPVEIELAVRGPLGGEEWPEVRGSAKLSGFTFRHASMLQPMERVQATVTLDGRRVEVSGLSAAIGSSDVAGSLRLAGTDPPRLVIDLSSRNADFWELFSFIAPEEEAAAGAPAQEDPLADLIVEGKIAIASGSLATLSFKNLQSELDYRSSILTLDPLTLDLYEGSFSGRLSQDMSRTPGILRMHGSIENVATDPFLAANLDLGGILSGSAGADLDIEVRTGDQETLMTSLSGGGPINIANGHMAKLEVLRPLSRVAGIFGERTAKRLTNQLSSEGTDFVGLDMKLAFGGGQAMFDDLLLATPVFELLGNGAIDMISGRLDGSFRAEMSPEISALMREEDSRAASLFWDSSRKVVSIPFTLKGPADAPAAGVDWQGAARSRIERKAGDKLRGLLEKRLGVKETETAAAAAPEAPAVEGTAQPAPPQGESSAPTAQQELRAEITRVRKGSSLLLPDLIVEGVVEGANIDRASLRVVDSRGHLLKQVDSIPAVADYMAAAADPAARATIDWRVAVDGKKAALASSPLTIELVLYDTAGRSTTTTRQE